MQTLINERGVSILTLLCIATALLLSTLGAEFSDVGSAHSPVFFPRIILTGWIALCVLALLQNLSVSDGGKGIDNLWRLVVMVVAVVVYTNLVTKLGFFLTSAGFALICLPMFGIRKPVILIIYAVAVPGTLVALFNHTLGMPLPTSPFSYLF